MSQKIQKAIVVAVIFNEQGQLLIAQRRDPEVPEADGKWEFVGGHIEFGEDPEAAVIREVKEETGLEVEVIRLLPKIYNNDWQTKTGDLWQVLLLFYHCRIIGGELQKVPTDKKIQALKFINLSEVNNYDFLPNALEPLELLKITNP